MVKSKEVTAVKKIINSKKKSKFNDIRRIRRVDAVESVQEHSRFSLSFVIMLVASTIIATLGLLLGSTPIVIGAMIISPLMWPLMKTSLGLVYEKRSYAIQSVAIVLLSTVISVGTAFLITEVSPIKAVNDEIIARTNPNFLDIIVGLASGIIASLALVLPRVSQGVAGVAISASLIPPLCVGGIGLSIWDLEIVKGSLLLFLGNIVAIIFASIIVFLIVGMNRQAGGAARINAFLVAVILVVTSVPFFFYLMNYSFQSNAYTQTQTVLIQEFEDISPAIRVSNIKTNFEDDVIIVEADVEIPEDISIDYQQRQQISTELEDSLGHDIDLNLRVFRTISIVTEDDIISKNIKKLLSDTLLEEVGKINSFVSVESIVITENPEKAEGRDYDILVSVVLYAEPTTSITYAEKNQIESSLNNSVDGKKIALEIEIISLTSLKKEVEPEQIKLQDIKQSLENSIASLTEGTDISLQVSGVNMKRVGQVLSLDFKIDAPYSFLVEDYKPALHAIKQKLEKKYSENIDLHINIVYHNILDL